MSSYDNSPTDNERNIALYSELLEKHGDSYRSLNWGSAESQKLRFSVLAGAGISTDDSVLDLGCGLGDLYQWFKDSSLEVVYQGLDLTPVMVSRAIERFPDGQFAVGSIDQFCVGRACEYDYVVASGIFAHRQQQEMKFLRDTVTTMFSISRKGIAFNCLSSWREDKDQGEFYADPLEIVDLCRSISPRLTFRHDYHPGDFTIYLYKTGFPG